MTADSSAASETRTFRATPAELTELDRWMEHIGAQWAVAERAMFRTRVCIAELVANAMEHGGADPERDTVTITLHRLEPDIGIEYADTAAPFDPTIPRAPASSAAEDVSLGGRGLQLLQAYASQLSYRHDGKRNVVRFRVTAGQAFPGSRTSPAFSS
jgi:anti-sigma regulatory factor (Ser/Thr protein kinase)